MVEYCIINYRACFMNNLKARDGMIKIALAVSASVRDSLHNAPCNYMLITPKPFPVVNKQSHIGFRGCNVGYYSPL